MERNLQQTHVNVIFTNGSTAAPNNCAMDLNTIRFGMNETLAPSSSVMGIVSTSSPSTVVTLNSNYHKTISKVSTNNNKANEIYLPMTMSAPIAIPNGPSNSNASLITAIHQPQGFNNANHLAVHHQHQHPIFEGTTGNGTVFELLPTNNILGTVNQQFTTNTIAPKTATTTHTPTTILNINNHGAQINDTCEINTIAKNFTIASKTQPPPLIRMSSHTNLGNNNANSNRNNNRIKNQAATNPSSPVILNQLVKKELIAARNTGVNTSLPIADFAKPININSAIPGGIPCRQLNQPGQQYPHTPLQQQKPQQQHPKRTAGVSLNHTGLSGHTPFNDLQGQGLIKQQQQKLQHRQNPQQRQYIYQQKPIQQLTVEQKKLLSLRKQQQQQRQAQQVLKSKQRQHITDKTPNILEILTIPATTVSATGLNEKMFAIASQPCLDGINNISNDNLAEDPMIIQNNKTATPTETLLHSKPVTTDGSNRNKYTTIPAATCQVNDTLNINIDVDSIGDKNNSNENAMNSILVSDDNSDDYDDEEGESDNGANNFHKQQNNSNVTDEYSTVTHISNSVILTKAPLHPEGRASSMRNMPPEPANVVLMKLPPKSLLGTGKGSISELAYEPLNTAMAKFASATTLQIANTDTSNGQEVAPEDSLLKQSLLTPQLKHRTTTTTTTSTTETPSATVSEKESSHSTLKGEVPFISGKKTDNGQFSPRTKRSKSLNVSSSSSLSPQINHVSAGDSCQSNNSNTITERRHSCVPLRKTLTAKEEGNFDNTDRIKNQNVNPKTQNKSNDNLDIGIEVSPSTPKKDVNCQRLVDANEAEIIDLNDDSFEEEYLESSTENALTLVDAIEKMELNETDAAVKIDNKVTKSKISNSYVTQHKENMNVAQQKENQDALDMKREQSNAIDKAHLFESSVISSSNSLSETHDVNKNSILVNNNKNHNSNSNNSLISSQNEKQQKQRSVLEKSLLCDEKILSSTSSTSSVNFTAPNVGSSTVLQISNGESSNNTSSASSLKSNVPQKPKQSSVQRNRHYPYHSQLRSKQHSAQQNQQHHQKQHSRQKLLKSSVPGHELPSTSSLSAQVGSALSTIQAVYQRKKASSNSVEGVYGVLLKQTSASSSALSAKQSDTETKHAISNFKSLAWKDRVGSARGTSLRFQLNEFNLLQIHERIPFRQHFKTAYEKPVYERDPLPQKATEQADPLLYLCRRCNRHGPAVHFLAPGFCSHDCLKRDRPKQNKGVIAKSLQTDNHVMMQQKFQSSKFQSSALPVFRWSSYLASLHNSITAPIGLFLNPFPSGQNEFQVGMKLEAIDPLNCSLFCVCTIVDIQGYRLRLSFDGYDRMHDFWVNADSMDIFPPGWCQKTNRILQPPRGMSSHKFSWNTYLIKHKAQAASRQLFTHLNNSALPTRHSFEVGMYLEAEDLNDTRNICVASVADVLDERIRVHFDGWETSYDYWIHVNSPYLHPCGWHEGRTQLCVPPEFENSSFSWPEYIKQAGGRAAPAEFFVPRDPIDFRTGMKLEVVDTKNRQLIRPATVVGRKGHRVKLHFDCWPNDFCVWLEDESPDLHPITWCETTGHDIEPPPGFQQKKSELPCTTYGCRGIGNAKRPHVASHASRDCCPYVIENWKDDKYDKPRRVEIKDIVCHLPAPSKFVASSAVATTQKPNNKRQVTGNNNNNNNNSVDGCTSNKRAKSNSHLNANQSVNTKSSSRLEKDKKTVHNATNNGGNNKSNKNDISRRDSENSLALLSTSHLPPLVPIRLQNGKVEESATDNGKVCSEQVKQVKQEVEIDIVINKEKCCDDKENKYEMGKLKPCLQIAERFLRDYGPRLQQNYDIWSANNESIFDFEQFKQCSKNPLQWSIAETGEFIKKIVGNEEVAKSFISQEIDGAALLMLQQEDLTDILTLKLGPAVKLFTAVLKLRTIACDALSSSETNVDKT